MSVRKSTIAAMMATALAAAGASAQTAPTQPVKVGIIDTSVQRLMLGYKDVAIEKRIFIGEGKEAGDWTAVPGHTHGDVVASSFVQQSREIDKRVPIAVYSANAFYQQGPRDPNGNRRMSLDFAGAEKALEWFHDNGVRTVVTAFYTQDGPNMRSFMKKAEDLGIVLFAGTNNDKTRTVPFPARDPYAIAVTGNNPNLDFAGNAGMRKWTAFQMNGDTPSPQLDATEENGSSFAVARAAAYGAHYVRMNPTATRDQVVEVLGQSSGQAGTKHVASLDGGDVAKRFRSITYNRMVIPAKGRAQQIADISSLRAMTASAMGGGDR